MSLRLTSPTLQVVYDNEGQDCHCSVRRVINLPVAIVFSRKHGWCAYVSYCDPFSFDAWSIYRGGRKMHEALAAVESMLEHDFRQRRI